MAKNLLLGAILAHLAQIQDANFFFSSSKIWLHQLLDIKVSYHHVQYQKKTNDPVLRKPSDRRTDGQAQESDFIGRCPTNRNQQEVIQSW